MKLIPPFHAFYATAVQLIPAGADRILDLGAGTGLLSAFARERFPEARLHLIDHSEPMLAQARQRFQKDGKASLQLGDYTTAAWGSQYDAVVSALSIHHLPDDAKQRLLQRIQAGLRPGGVYINAEQILQSTPELEEVAKADWLNEVRALGATEAEVSASLLRQSEDRCATVEDQLQWMAETGFARVSCPFQQGRFAVLVGTATS